jgi:hypothetical protein
VRIELGVEGLGSWLGGKVKGVGKASAGDKRTCLYYYKSVSIIHTF